MSPVGDSRFPSMYPFIGILHQEWPVLCFMPSSFDDFFSLSPHLLSLLRQIPSSGLSCSCGRVRIRHCSFAGSLILTCTAKETSQRNKAIHLLREVESHTETGAPSPGHLRAWESHLPCGSLSVLISKLRGRDQMISKFLPVLMMNTSFKKWEF